MREKRRFGVNKKRIVNIVIPEDLYNNKEKSKEPHLHGENDDLSVSNDVASLPRRLRRFKISRTDILHNGQVKKHIFNFKRKVLLVFTLILPLSFLLLVTLMINSFYGSYERLTGNAAYLKDLSARLIDDVKDKDISSLDDYMNAIQESLKETKHELDNYSFFKNFQFLGGYYKNLSTLQEILDQIVKIIDLTVPSLKVILQESGFKLENSDEALEGNQNDSMSAMQKILKNLPKYLDLYKQLEPEIYLLLSKIKQIDGKYLPNISNFDFEEILFGVSKVEEKYPEISESLISFISNIPELIGFGKRVSYLLVLQNETELRGSGGLITAYGVVTLENGEVVGDINLTDTWVLENYVSTTLGIDVGYRNFGGQNHLMYGSSYLRSWSCGSSYMRAQDSGIYPDLYISTMMFKDYYDIASKYNPKDYPKYDHIIIVNYTFSENLMGLIQPLVVEPYGVVTAETLYDFIKAETDNFSKYGFFGRDRKRILSEISEELKKKLFSLSTEDVLKLIKMVLHSFKAKDISLSSTNEVIQTFFDGYGLTARVPTNLPFDYFHFNEAQNCALKLNKWIRNSVSQEISIDDQSGAISKTVEVNWVNEKVYENSIKEQYDITGRYTYRAWVRFFFPEGSSKIRTNAFEKSGYTLFRPQFYVDKKMGYQTIDGVIEFDHRRLSEKVPPPRHSLSASWVLPDSLNFNKSKEYKMLIQKHPGKSWGEVQTIKINHKENVYITTFVLDQDKLVTYRDGLIIVENYHTKLNLFQELIDNIFSG